jgi:hypothetical protein
MKDVNKLISLFKKADSNNDGRVTEDELQKYKSELEKEGGSQDDIDAISQLFMKQGSATNFTRLCLGFGTDPGAASLRLPNIKIASLEKESDQWDQFLEIYTKHAGFDPAKSHCTIGN